MTLTLGKALRAGILGDAIVISRILIVDDSRAIVDTLQETLRRLGVEPEHIFTASNAAEAMRIFHEQNPSVVFMDVDLAAERGDHVAKQMLDLVPTTKVVLMTGLDLGEPRIRAVVSAGAYDVIQKPLRMSRLKQLMELIDSEERGLRRI